MLATASNASPKGQIIFGIIALVAGIGLWSIRRTIVAGMRRQRTRRGEDLKLPDAGDYLTAYGGPIFVVVVGLAAIIHGALTA